MSWFLCDWDLRHERVKNEQERSRGVLQKKTVLENFTKFTGPALDPFSFLIKL